MGHRFLGSHRRTSHAFQTLSRTFIVGCICLTKNTAFFTRGGIYPFLLCPTHVLFILCNHETHFGRCPITELTTHSLRMMNDHNHSHTPNTMQCPRAYTSCYMYKEHYMKHLHSIFYTKYYGKLYQTHDLHPFMLIYLNTHISTYFQHIQHVIQFPVITHQKRSTQTSHSQPKIWT